MDEPYAGSLLVLTWPFRWKLGLWKINFFSTGIWTQCLAQLFCALFFHSNWFHSNSHKTMILCGHSVFNLIKYLSYLVHTSSWCVMSECCSNFFLLFFLPVYGCLACASFFFVVVRLTSASDSMTSSLCAVWKPEIHLCVRCSYFSQVSTRGNQRELLHTCSSSASSHPA